MDGVPDDPQARTIVAAILQLAAACDCDVVAEGIETQGQLELPDGARLQDGPGLPPGAADAGRRRHPVARRRDDRLTPGVRC